MSGSSLYGPFGIVNNVVNSGSIEYAALQTAAQANLNTAGFGQVNFTAGSLNTDTSGVNSIVDNVSLALSAGDEISVQMDNVGPGTSWNDPIVYLMFQVN